MIDLNNTVVHCPTEELAQKVLAKADKLGYKWYCGESFLDKTYWDCFKENTVYCIYDGFVSEKEHVKRDGIKIISAEEFLAEDFNAERNNKAMEIKVGDRFKCIKSLVMCNGRISYKIGNIYQSEVDDCITDDQGDKLHSMGNDKGFIYERFVRLQDNNTIAADLSYTNILQEANEIVNGSRHTDYGSATESFDKISQIASVLSRKELSPKDCAVVMMAVKLVRESYKHKRDNLVDLCGYANILNEIEDDAK